MDALMACIDHVQAIRTRNIHKHPRHLKRAHYGVVWYVCSVGLMYTLDNLWCAPRAYDISRFSTLEFIICLALPRVLILFVCVYIVYYGFIYRSRPVRNIRTYMEPPSPTTTTAASFLSNNDADNVTIHSTAAAASSKMVPVEQPLKWCSTSVSTINARVDVFAAKINNNNTAGEVAGKPRPFAATLADAMQQLRLSTQDWCAFMFSPSSSSNPWWNDTYHREFIRWRFPVWRNVVFPGMATLDTQPVYREADCVAGQCLMIPVAESAWFQERFKRAATKTSLPRTLVRSITDAPLCVSSDALTHTPSIPKVLSILADGKYDDQFPYALALGIYQAICRSDYSSKVVILRDFLAIDLSVEQVLETDPMAREIMGVQLVELTRRHADVRATYQWIRSTLISVTERAPSLGLRCMTYFYTVLMTYNSVYTSLLAQGFHDSVIGKNSAVELSLEAILVVHNFTYVQHSLNALSFRVSETDIYFVYLFFVFLCHLHDTSDAFTQTLVELFYPVLFLFGGEAPDNSILEKSTSAFFASARPGRNDVRDKIDFDFAATKRTDLGEWLFWYIVTAHVETSRRHIWKTHNVPAKQRSTDCILFNRLHLSLEDARVTAIASSVCVPGPTGTQPKQVFPLPVQCNGHFTGSGAVASLPDAETLWNNIHCSAATAVSAAAPASTVGVAHQSSSSSSPSSSSCTAPVSASAKKNMRRRLRKKKEKVANAVSCSSTGGGDDDDADEDNGLLECLICFALSDELFVPPCGCIVKEILCRACFDRQCCPLPSFHQKQSHEAHRNGAPGSTRSCTF